MNKNIINDSKKYILYNYFIKEEIECGIVLLSWETKSIRYNGCSIVNSYAFFLKKECWLYGMIINLPPFLKEYKNERNKKILLKRKEINKYQNIIKTNKMTLVPSTVYWKNNFIKLQLCLVSGKKNRDKKKEEKIKNWKNIKNFLN